MSEKIRVLVVGSGGREHALVWKIAQSKLVDKIFCAPGNAGISSLAECLDIKAEDVQGLLDFARREEIGLTVVGPEAALSCGIADEFQRQGLDIFGPNKAATRLESSKVFAKELMAKYGLPTASFKVFSDSREALNHLDKFQGPCVVKADGLAQGKGVVVAHTQDEARQAVKAMMEERIFQDAGSRVVIEELLEGQEVSILVFTDSKEVVPLASSQDHKRVFDQDKGLNTGGMGAYSPAPAVTEGLFKEIQQKIIYRIIDGLAREGIEYRGVLYAGIMLTKEGPRVLEFNVRFGDPETQAVLPRLKSDLVEVMLAVSRRRLSEIGSLHWDGRACVCVVCASGGYPGNYEKGQEITGLDAAGGMQDIMVFHAGTKLIKVNGKTQIITNGGRVLGVTGMGGTIKEAIQKTYQAVEKIHFRGMHYRKDIAMKALA
ncbi:MAG: phosphoribosylamine--glycine ligase [Candidatus Omnitrophota bacterium]